MLIPAKAQITHTLNGIFPNAYYSEMKSDTNYYPVRVASMGAFPQFIRSAYNFTAYDTNTGIIHYGTKFMSTADVISGGNVFSQSVMIDSMYVLDLTASPMGSDSGPALYSVGVYKPVINDKFLIVRLNYGDLYTQFPGPDTILPVRTFPTFIDTIYKIHYYNSNNTDERLAFIGEYNGNINCYIHYSILANICTIYQPRGFKLLDIVSTLDYAVLLGITDEGNVCILRHDKHDPDTYVCKEFTSTASLTDFHITVADYGTDRIVIGGVRQDNPNFLEFSTIDLSSFTVTLEQQVQTPISCEFTRMTYLSGQNEILNLLHDKNTNSDFSLILNPNTYAPHTYGFMFDSTANIQRFKDICWGLPTTYVTIGVHKHYNTQTEMRMFAKKIGLIPKTNVVQVLSVK